MLGISVGSAILAFLLVSVTFSKELLYHQLSAQQQGQAVAIAHTQILQVNLLTYNVKLCFTYIDFPNSILFFTGLEFTLAKSFSANFALLGSDCIWLLPHAYCYEFQCLFVSICYNWQCLWVLSFKSLS